MAESRFDSSELPRDVEVLALPYDDMRGDFVGEDAGLADRLKDELMCRPSVVGMLHLSNKLSGIIEAGKSDVMESDQKVSTITFGALAFATQALDRMRVVIVFAPELATRVLDSTHSSVATGATAAAVFMGWNLVMGESLIQALGRFPNATDKFKEEFPSVVELFESSLPGMSDDVADIASGESNIPLSERSTWRERVALHTRRALTGAGIGSTAFVATAATQGKTTTEQRKVNVAVSTDTGALIQIVGMGVAESIMELPKHGHIELAQDIGNAVADTRLWLGVAAVSMVAEYLSHRNQTKEADRTYTEQYLSMEHEDD